MAEEKRIVPGSTTNAKTQMSEEFDFTQFGLQRLPEPESPNYEVGAGGLARGFAAGTTEGFRGMAEMVEQGGNALEQKSQDDDVGGYAAKALRALPMVRLQTAAAGLWNDALGGLGDWIESKMTDDERAAMSAQLVNQSDDGQWSVSDDPAVWSMQIANIFGQMTPTVVTALATGGATATATAARLMPKATQFAMKLGAKPAVAEKAAAMAVKMLQSAPAAGVGIASDLGVQGLDAGEGVLNSDFSQLANSDIYRQEFMAIHRDPQFADLDDTEKLTLARERVSDMASRATMTDPRNIAASVAATMVGDVPLANTLLKGGKGGLRGMGQGAAVGAVREAPMEMVQEGTQQRVSNEISNEYAGTNLDANDGVIEAMAAGGLLGGAVGGGMGGVGGLRKATQPETTPGTDNIENNNEPPASDPNSIDVSSTVNAGPTNEPDSPERPIGEEHAGPQHDPNAVDVSATANAGPVEPEWVDGNTQEIQGNDHGNTKRMPEQLGEQAQPVISNPEEYLQRLYAADAEKADALLDAFDEQKITEVQLYQEAEKLLQQTESKPKPKVKKNGLRSLRETEQSGNFDDSLDSEVAEYTRRFEQRKQKNLSRYTQAIEQGRGTIKAAKDERALQPKTGPSSLGKAINKEQSLRQQADRERQLRDHQAPEPQGYQTDTTDPRYAQAELERKKGQDVPGYQTDTTDPRYAQAELERKKGQDVPGYQTDTTDPRYAQAELERQKRELEQELSPEVNQAVAERAMERLSAAKQKVASHKIKQLTTRLENKISRHPDRSKAELLLEAIRTDPALKQAPDIRNAVLKQLQATFARDTQAQLDEAGKEARLKNITTFGKDHESPTFWQDQSISKNPEIVDADAALEQLKNERKAQDIKTFPEDHSPNFDPAVSERRKKAIVDKVDKLQKILAEKEADYNHWSDLRAELYGVGGEDTPVRNKAYNALRKKLGIKWSVPAKEMDVYDRQTELENAIEPEWLRSSEEYEAVRSEFDALPIKDLEEYQAGLDVIKDGDEFVWNGKRGQIYRDGGFAKFVEKNQSKKDGIKIQQRELNEKGIHFDGLNEWYFEEQAKKAATPTKRNTNVPKTLSGKAEHSASSELVGNAKGNGNTQELPGNYQGKTKPKSGPMARTFKQGDFDQDVTIQKVGSNALELKANDDRITGTYLPVKVNFDPKMKEITVDDDSFSYAEGGFKEARQAALARAKERVKMKADVVLEHQDGLQKINKELKLKAGQSRLESWQQQLKEEEAALEAAKRVIKRMDRGWNPKPEDIAEMTAPFDGALKRYHQERAWDLVDKIFPKRIAQIKDEIAKLSKGDFRQKVIDKHSKKDISEPEVDSIKGNTQELPGNDQSNTRELPIQPESDVLATARQVIAQVYQKNNGKLKGVRNAYKQAGITAKQVDAEAQKAGIGTISAFEKQVKSELSDKPSNTEPQSDSRLDAAADSISDAKRKAALKLKALLDAQKGRTNSGVDPAIMLAVAEVGALSVAEGAVKFAQYVRDVVKTTRAVGIDDAQVEGFLKESYGAISANPEKYGISEEVADSMDLPREVRKTDVAKLVGSNKPEPDPDGPKGSKPKTNPVRQALLAKDGGKPRIDSITDNNQLKALVAEVDGVKVKELAPLRIKEGQEQYEAALAERVHMPDLVSEDAREQFDMLVDYYNSQPRLDYRSSSSMDNQAYSTPIPYSWVAGKLIGLDGNAKVYEPTAGNGLLLTAARDLGRAHANELQAERKAALDSLGVGTVTQEDATSYKPKGKMDAVITNPPFGKFDKPVKFGHVTFKRLEHVIAARALETLKSDGKAAIILGAHRDAGKLNATDRQFFNWLASNFQVVDHIEIDGKLYGRQGTTYPTRMVVIDGRRTGKPLRYAPQAIERLSTWNELYDRYAEILDGRRALTDSRETFAGSGVTESIGLDDAMDQLRGGQSLSGNQAGNATTVGESGRGTDDAGAGRGEVSDNVPAGQRPVRSSQESDSKSGNKNRASQQSRTQTESRGGADGRSRSNHTVAKASSNQTDYQTRSKGFNEAVFMPPAMAENLRLAMDEVEKAVGDIDEFVADKLQYPQDELFKHFMGLQIDSIAAAIYNAETHNEAIVIADQTGVGKGRQVAGLMRYARLQGHVPVFITEKPDLFSDMARDLRDIDELDNINPMIVNADVGMDIVEDGEIKNLVKRRGSSAIAKDMRNFVNNTKLPKGKNAVFLTYSQVSSAAEGSLKRNFIEALAPHGWLLMDEAHNAAGERENMKVVDGEPITRITGAGHWFNILPNAQGVTYLSATFAKRADNLPVFYQTQLGRATDTLDDMVEALQHGGVPVQSLFSAALTRAGQLFRRERSLDGISFPIVINYDNQQQQEQAADKAANVINGIILANESFEADSMPLIEENIGDMGLEAKLGGNKAADSIAGTNFTDVMHNMIGQLLLAIKADTAADAAIADLKAGKKPIITLNNTMGSFLEDVIRQDGLEVGDEVSLDFKHVMTKALQNSHAITITDENDRKEKFVVPLDNGNLIHPRTRQLYKKAYDAIKAFDADLPASPIDYIRQRLEAAGFSAQEMTGRKYYLDMSGKVPVLKSYSKADMDKVAIRNRYNNDEVDALVVNVAASSGWSGHNAEGTVNKVRTMIVAQPNADINRQVQLFGRVNRTGQRTVPEYQILGTPLPVEMRQLGVLAMRLNSLNAQTSANAKTDISIDAPDMDNRYGDLMATRILVDEPMVARKARIRVPEDAMNNNNYIKIGAFKQLTGRIAATLSIDEQRRVWGMLTSSYNDHIEMLNRTGRNDLELKVLELDAKPTELKPVNIYEGDGTDNPMTGGYSITEYSVKKLGKPPTWSEVKKAKDKALKGVEPSQFNESLLEKWANDTAFIDDVRQKIKEKEPKREALASEVEAATELYEDPKEYPEDLVLKSHELSELNNDLRLLKMAETRYESAKSVVQERLGRFKVGDLVALDIQGQNVTGAITNIESKQKKGRNPFVPSQIKVTVYLDSGQHHLTLPLSQMTDMEGAISQFYFRPAREADFTEALAPTLRENRYVAEGNLLQAVADLVERGGNNQPVQFVDHKGVTRNGVLLSRNFESPQEFADKRPVKVKPEQAANLAVFLQQDFTSLTGQKVRPKVSSKDKKLVVGYKPKSGDYYIRIPTSKIKGDAKPVYYDQGLREMVGEFVQGRSGDRYMWATIPFEKGADVLNYMAERDYLYLLDHKKEFAGQATEETESIASAIRFAVSRVEDKGRVTEVVKGNKAFVDDVINSILAKWDHPDIDLASMVTVVPAVEDLPQYYIDDIKRTDGEDCVNGFYHMGKIYVIAERLHNRALVEEVLLHELLGHYGIRALFNGKSVTRELMRIQKKIGSEKRLLEMAESFGIDLDDYVKMGNRRLTDGVYNIDQRKALLVDELIAFLAGKKQFASNFDRLIHYIREKLRSWGMTIKFGKADLRSIVSKASEAAINPIKPTANQLAQDRMDALRRGGLPGDMRFHRVGEAIRATRGMKPSGIIDRAKAFVERGRPAFLGMLTNLQLADTYGKIMGDSNRIEAYQKLLAQMEAKRNNITHDAEIHLDDQWEKLSGDEAQELGGVMYDATMYAIHPDRPLEDQPRFIQLVSDLADAESEGQASRMARLQDQIDIMETNYNELRHRYDSLSEDARQLYQDTEAFYQDAWESLKEALEQRITERGGDESEHAAMRDKIKTQFENALQVGPYFPLSRFGDYVVRAKTDEEYIRTHFPSRYEAEQYRQELLDSGDFAAEQVTVSKKEQMDPNELGQMQKLGTETLKLLGAHTNAQGLVDQASLTDDIWQLMLTLMPDNSYARHAIHRKRTPGASLDMRRAFADSATSFAFHISKIEFGHRMQTELDNLRTDIEKTENMRDSSIDPDDLIVARELLHEMAERHELTMNPRGKAWASWLGSFGFVMYLGASPAAGLVNLTQTAFVALPQMAAKHGWSRASRELLRAAGEYVSSPFKAGTREAWKSLTRSDKLRKDEKDLLKKLYVDGVLDLTQAHALMQMADTDTRDQHSISKGMETALRYTGTIFHNAEVMNREVTALAAYRMIREKEPGLSKEEYSDKVAKMVYDGHFNYASSNRPRLMRGDVAKVLLQFKQYSQHMIYNLARGASATVKDATKKLSGKERIEEEKLLRRQFTGILAMHFMAAGALGLPMVSTVLGALSAAFSDDDEPFDAETELRLWLAQEFGPDVGDVIARGVLDKATGLNFSGRVGLGDLIYREPQQELSAREYGMYVLQQLAGPVVGGIGLNTFSAMGYMADGDVYRGMEKLAPKFIRDPMKAWRYGQEGELTRSSGDAVVSQDEFSAFELAGQALGFSPARVSKAYDVRRSIKNMEAAYNARRGELLKAYGRAFEAKDQEQLADVIEQIQHWNRLNPRLAITNQTLQASLRRSNRNHQLTERGTYLPTSRQWLRQYGDY